MSFYVVMIRTVSILAIAGVIGAVVLLAAHLTAGGRAQLRQRLAGGTVDLMRQAAAVALIATVGSLYLSNGVGFTPCVLCWYQRIAMYPLVVIAGVAALTRDSNGWRYGLPLSLTGLLIAIYHVALQYQPALDVVSCDASAPCTGRHVLVFGFISIPVLSGAAFAVISALLLTARTVGRGEDNDAMDLHEPSTEIPGA